MPMTRRRERELHESALEWAAFQNPNEWRLSKAGNLWRRYCGLSLTLFDRGGSWLWAIASADKRTYSTGRFSTLDEARDNLAEALGVRGGSPLPKGVEIKEGDYERPPWE